jgi:photosystem II stability/assembly factor-like uncharacterized protein
MIQRLLSALLLLGILVTGADAQVKYESVKPFGFDLRTVDIVWPSTTTGYAAARRNTDAEPVRGAVLKSVDGGASWTMINRDGINMYDIDAVSETTVFTVGASLQCNCAAIQKTTDAGSNWTEQTFAGITELRAIDFTSATVGYAVGASGAVLKTTDAGANWTNIGPGPSESVTFTSLHFPSPNVGYAIAMYSALTEPNRLYKTVNAGVTWTKIMDQGNETVNKPVFYDIWATKDSTVYMAGREIIRRLFMSTDGGATWRSVYNGLPGPLPFTMGAIEFVNDTLGFAAGDYGTMLRTTNGGLFWTKEDIGTTAALTALGFASPYAGIVGGLSGEFYLRSIAELPTVDVSASSINFGTIATGSKDMQIVVSPANGAGLTITGIEINDFEEAGFSLVDPTQFPIELAADEEQTITVRFTPKAGLNDRVFGQLIIETNDARTPEKQISLVADARVTTGNAQIAVSTSSIDFGTLIERQAKNMTLEISAGTDVTLVIDSLWINRQGPGAEAFSIVSPTTYPDSIVAGQPLTVTLRYAPSAPTQFPAAAELVILSNDPDNTELRVSLTGAAQEDPAGVEDEALRSALAISTTPNPTGDMARVSMTLPSAGHLSARVVDARGTIVATLVDAQTAAGPRSFALDATTLPAGAYTLVVSLDGRTASTRLSVVR